jgi:2-isopropylmalate synthase
MDQVLVNLRLLGWIDRDLSALAEYVQKVALYARVPIPDGYPVVGRDAFRTGTGVHAAAIIKARRKGSDWLADRVYSGVPAGAFGLEQVIEVGPMCGLSNVVYWLALHGYPQEESLAQELLQLAKTTNRVLTDDELHSAERRRRERGASGSHS